LFFLFRFFRLGHHDFWYDEIFTLNYARCPWHNWNAPLYYLSLHYWTNIFGISEFSLRLPSLIFSFCSLILLYFLGKTLFNKKVGIISSILIGLSPFHIWYAQEAREYAMILFFGLLSSLLFSMALKNGKVKLWLFFILVSIVGLYTHYFYIFLVLAQCLYLLYIRKFKIDFKGFLSYFINRDKLLSRKNKKLFRNYHNSNNIYFRLRIF
jgi:4-amino-4-deoxy-L-arabinose transferase-like glycosyltransferase